MRYRVPMHFVTELGAVNLHGLTLRAPGARHD